MNDPMRFSTTVEECLIRAAHVSIVQHVQKLELLHHSHAVPDDPLEIPTLGIVITTRLGHARRLQASITGLVACCSDANDSHHAERDHLQRVLTHTTSLIEEMEVMAARSQALVIALAERRHAARGCYHAY